MEEKVAVTIFIDLRRIVNGQLYFLLIFSIILTHIMMANFCLAQSVVSKSLSIFKIRVKLGKKESEKESFKKSFRVI